MLEMQSMNWIKLLYKFMLMIAVLSVTGCYFQNGKSSSNDKNRIMLDGWERVAFADRSDYFSKNRGDLSASYDEFVGALIDQGLEVDNTEWLKPTYGSQNYLWTSTAKIGNQQKKMLNASKSEYSPNFYEFYDGEIEYSNVRWLYSGYIDKIEGVYANSFRMFIFVCKGESSNGVSVFYWGSGISMLPIETEDTKILLSKLSTKCV